MDLSAVGIVEIAKLVSAVALVASLIFIGVEPRQSANTSRAQHFRRTQCSGRTSSLSWPTPRPGGPMRGAEGGTDLTGEEFGRFYFICRTILMGCENLHYQFTHGPIDDDAYRGYAASIAARPGVQAMWSIQRHIYSAELQCFSDKQIAKGEASPNRPTLERWKGVLPDAIPDDIPSNQT